MYEQQVVFYENYKKTVDKISELEHKAGQNLKHRIQKLRRSFEKLNSKYEIYQIDTDLKDQDEQYQKLNNFLQQQKDLQDRIFCLEQQIIYANQKKTQNEDYIVNQSRLSILEDELFRKDERFQNFQLKKNDYQEVTEIIHELKEEVKKEQKQIKEIFRNLSINNSIVQVEKKYKQQLKSIDYTTKSIDITSSIDLSSQNENEQSITIQKNIQKIQQKFFRWKNFYNSMRNQQFNSLELFKFFFKIALQLI